MGKNRFEIYDLRTEQICNPIGLDKCFPVFSWKLKSEKRNTIQKKARIYVGKNPGGSEQWDSGILDTGCSSGISYGGSALQPESVYYVSVKVWNQDDEYAETEGCFETGMLNPDISAWEGAQWIGAPEYMVSAEKLSVFVIESSIAVKKGSRAGIVLGADDSRLLDKRKNELLTEGPNDIRFVLNVEEDPAVVEVYRRGYCPEDQEDVPLYVIPAVDLKTGNKLITKENKREFHRLTVEVEGNGAYTYLDGVRIDEDVRNTSYGNVIVPRQLNPLGAFDVTTYPRLCKIGYYCGEGSEAEFDGLRVKNLRKPEAELLTFDTESIKKLTGEAMEIFDPSCHSLPMFRRNFYVKGKVVSARLYATARGIYECSINGKTVGNEYFAPGASQYDKHLMYQTYDVTDFLKQGENGIGCILASGWWSDSFSFRLYNFNYWGDKPSFLGKLVICYENGQREVFVTDDKNWEYYGEGPYRYAGFFNGEEYDARKAEIYHNLSKADFVSADGKKPEIIKTIPMDEQEGIFPGACCWPAMNLTEPNIVGNYQAPVHEVEIFTAKSVSEPVPGTYIYDLGQEIAGVPRIRLCGKPGQKITIRYGEILYPDLKEYKGLAGQMLQANLREASNTDIYICRGDEEEVYQPRFTFHGYRYIEISGVEKALPLKNVQGVLLSSVEKITGSFKCDNELVNRFTENVKYSQYCNFISIPTDCPQRNERMGWMGDTHIFCRTASYQSNVKNFYLRNLQAMKDMQTEDGRLPSIAPFGGGFGGQTYESAMILVVWELYQQYGDLSVVQEFYDSMDRWMDSMEKAGLPGLPELPHNAWLGDWLAPVPADDHLIFNAFHYRNACLMKKFASLIRRLKDVDKYEKVADETRKFWNKMFVDPVSGRTKNADGSLCDVQGSYSIGLSCGVFEENYEERAFAYLEEKTREGNYTIQSGFFGTGPINPMLSKGGYYETAQKTMTQTAYPSWLYPVTQGATTIWERWNSFTKENGFDGNNSMNSFNHYSLGSVLSWLYENVLGIQRDEENPGFRHFTLKPEMGTFEFAEGGIDTPYGRIESSWEKDAEGYLYRCTVPENTTATVVLANETRELGSGKYMFKI